MYVPHHFSIDDPDASLELMQAFPFALLLTTVNGESEGTHVPVLSTREGENFTLRFHLARANPAVEGLTLEQPSLVVFTGPNAYVSPDWYGDSKPNMVPTWNYAVVHARGIAKAVEDAALRDILDDLSAQSEQRLLPKKPWTSDKMDDRAFQAMRRAVVGYELKVTSMQTKFKMGQNRATDQRQGVRDALRALPQSNDQQPHLRVADLVPD